MTTELSDSIDEELRDTGGVEEISYSEYEDRETPESDEDENNDKDDETRLEAAERQVTDPGRQAAAESAGGNPEDWREVNKGGEGWVLDEAKGTIYNIVTGERYYGSSNPEGAIKEQEAVRHAAEGGGAYFHESTWEQQTDEGEKVSVIHLIFGEKDANGLRSVQWVWHETTVPRPTDEEEPRTIEMSEAPSAERFAEETDEDETEAPGLLEEEPVLSFETVAATDVEVPATVEIHYEDEIIAGGEVAAVTPAVAESVQTVSTVAETMHTEEHRDVQREEAPDPWLVDLLDFGRSEASDDLRDIPPAAIEPVAAEPTRAESTPHATQETLDTPPDTGRDPIVNIPDAVRTYDPEPVEMTTNAESHLAPETNDVPVVEYAINAPVEKSEALISTILMETKDATDPNQPSRSEYFDVVTSFAEPPEIAHMEELVGIPGYEQTVYEAAVHIEATAIAATQTETAHEKLSGTELASASIASTSDTPHEIHAEHFEVSSAPPAAVTLSTDRAPERNETIRADTPSAETPPAVPHQVQTEPTSNIEAIRRTIDFPTPDPRDMRSLEIMGMKDTTTIPRATPFLPPYDSLAIPKNPRAISRSRNGITLNMAA